MSRANVSPGRPHPEAKRYALASLAFLSAPADAASSWAVCSGVEQVMAASEVDRVVAVGGRVLSGRGAMAPGGLDVVYFMMETMKTGEVVPVKVL